MWCFDRERDGKKIKTEKIEWFGSFAFPGYEKISESNSLPNLPGVYLFTFAFKDGFLVYHAGVTSSTKNRIKQHIRDYKKGDRNVLDVSFAINGKRREIWHGWKYAELHREEFEENKTEILKAVNNQLKSSKIFVSEISNERMRYRIESSIMNNLYSSREYWSELADRGMNLKGRENCEMPIVVKNICNYKIYGLPLKIEV